MFGNQPNFAVEEIESVDGLTVARFEFSSLSTVEPSATATASVATTVEPSGLSNFALEVTVRPSCFWNLSLGATVEPSDFWNFSSGGTVEPSGLSNFGLEVTVGPSDLPNFQFGDGRTVESFEIGATGGGGGPMWFAGFPVSRHGATGWVF